MQPNNGLIGDESPTELPQAVVNEDAVNELRKKAKYSRSKEFQELKANMEARIAFYQQYLPGAIPVSQVPEEERGKYWAVANIVIAELQQVIDMYESSEELLQEINEQKILGVN